MWFSFAVALLVRVSYLFFFRESPYFRVPIVDSQWHDMWAWKWAEGTWNMGGRAFFRAPLYPFVLSLIYRVVGHDLVAVRIVQAVIGGSSAAAISGCGWRIGGRPVALWSGTMAALFGTLVFFDGELLIPNLLVALMSWALFCLLSATSRKSYVLASMLVGLAATARPNAIVLLPVCLVFIWMRIQDSAWVRTRFVAEAAVVALIPIGVVTLANFRAERTFVLIASQGGVNFYAGNNANATGRTAAVEELKDVANSWGEFVDASHRVAEQAVGRPLNSREVSDFWMEKAYRWIEDNPLDALRLNVKKLYYLINGYEMPNNRDLYYRSPFPLNVLVWKLRWFYFPWGIAFPLAALGSVVGVLDRRTRTNVGMVTSWVLIYGLSLVPFFICARFRMGMVPGVILLASFALTRGRELLRLPVLLTGILMLVLVNTNLYGGTTDDVVRERARRGVALMRGNRVEEGRQELRAVIEPANNDAHAAAYLAEYAFFLGESYHKEGDEKLALRYFRRSLTLGPSNVGVLITMANYLYEIGERGDAVLALEKAAALRPSDGAVWVDLGLGYEKDGRANNALEAYRRSIRLSPKSPRGYLRLGLLYQDLEEPDSAIAVWRVGAERAPDEFALHFNLALAYARQERPDLALEETEAALRINPDSEEAGSLRSRLENELSKRDDSR